VDSVSTNPLDVELEKPELQVEAASIPVNAPFNQKQSSPPASNTPLPTSFFQPLTETVLDTGIERPSGSRSTCLAPGTFTATANSGTFANDLSPDGCIVAGTFNNGAYKWTPPARIQRLLGQGAGRASVSADGGVVGADVKNAADQNTAGRWTAAGGWQSLGGLAGSTGCGSDLSHSYALSADGSKLVGLAWLSNCRAHGFVWEAGTGMVDLGAQVENRSSRASGISDDGSTIVGFDEHSTGHRRAAIWRGGVETILSENPSELQDATPDGSIVVGKGDSTQGAARWTENAGVWTAEYFGNLPGTTNATGLAVSDDGSVIVGISGSPLANSAFYWSASTGLVRMTDFLTSQGIDVTGWTLTSATGISADGKTISGNGGLASTTAWIVRLPD
jgi:probable HAF family extracellular repeat protein